MNRVPTAFLLLRGSFIEEFTGMRPPEYELELPVCQYKEGLDFDHAAETLNSAAW